MSLAQESEEEIEEGFYEEEDYYNLPEGVRN